VALLAMSLCACVASGPVKGELPRPRTVLDDFEAAGHTAIAWQASPGLAGNRLQFATTSAPQQAVHGHALHLQYWFADAALSLAPAGLHSQVAAVRLRLSLPNVDARAYDALVFWIKGDATQGFASTLEVGLRRPPASDAPRRLANGDLSPHGHHRALAADAPAAAPAYGY
jgi:hypothetical protein